MAGKFDFKGNVSLNSTGFDKGVKDVTEKARRAKAQIEGLKKSFGTLTSSAGIGSMAKLATGIGAASLAVEGLSTVVTSAIENSAEFGKAMSELSAITGVSGQDLDNLKEKIQDLSKNTYTPATEVANNFAAIGSALPSLLNDMEGLGKVSESAITLSKAGLMELGDATTALTNTMAQFNIGAEGSSQVMDILANASLLGSANIQQVSETIQRCGTAANSAGISLAQAASLTEVLAEKGLKGAEAGTALRNVFLSMSTKGIDEMNPKVVGLEKALEFLNEKSNDAAFMVKTFGQEGATAASILGQGIHTYNNLSGSINKVGAAARMAEKNFDNLSGDWEKVKTSWTNLMSSFNLESKDGGLRSVVQGLNEIIETIDEVLDMFKDTKSSLMSSFPTASLDTLIKLIKNAIFYVGQCVKNISELFDAFNDLGGGTNTVEMSFDLLVGCLTALAKAINLIIEACTWLVRKLVEVKNEIYNWAVQKIPFFETISNYINNLIDGFKKLLKASTDYHNYESSVGNKNNKSENPEDVVNIIQGIFEEAFRSNNPNKVKYFESLLNKEISEYREILLDAMTKKVGDDKIRDIQFIYDMLNNAKFNASSEYANRKREYEKNNKNYVNDYTPPKITTTSPSSPKIINKKHEKTIEDAEKEYSASIRVLTKQKEDEYISDLELLNKRKSALDKLIDFYYEQYENGHKLTTSEEERLRNYIKESKLLETQIKTREDEIKAEEDLSKESEKLKEKLDETTKSLNEKLKEALNKQDESSIGDKISSGVKEYDSKEAKHLGELISQYDKLKDTIDEVNKKSLENGIQIDTSEAIRSLSALEAEINSLAETIASSVGYRLENFQKQLDKTRNFIGDASTIANYAASWDSIGESWKNAESFAAKAVIVLQQLAGTLEMVNSVVNIAKTLSIAFTAAKTAETTATVTQESADAASLASATSFATAEGIKTSAAKVSTAALLEEAAAGYMAAHAYIPFAGFGIGAGYTSSAVALVKSLAATMAFAKGGIVPGSSWNGDNMMVRVNSGEMILNKSQQSRLWNFVNSGGIGGGGYTEVNLKVKGTDLVGVLNNYNAKKSRI